MRTTLGPVADSSCNISVKKGDKDFSAAVTQVKGANPDAVFYGGYYSEAAPLVQQLKDGGVTATFVSADGTMFAFRRNTVLKARDYEPFLNQMIDLADRLRTAYHAT